MNNEAENVKIKTAAADRGPDTDTIGTIQEQTFRQAQEEADQA